MTRSIPLQLLLLFTILLSFLSPLPGAEIPDTADADVLRRRAADFLWSQQHEDGGWHSETYALLRSGQALTPFVLHALLDGPEHEAALASARTHAALDFIRRNTREGVLGVADPDILEYPNYSTAYALRCLVAADRPQDQALIAEMRTYLLEQQYREATGFSASAAAFGGWGFGGRRPPGDPGHMDLAHTRRVLEALRQANGFRHPGDAMAYARAQDFLRRVQRHPESRPQADGDPSAQSTYDGGFYFSPVVLLANKGREAGAGENVYFRSYATATCDGILSLLAAGVPVTDARVRDAAAWLRTHPQLDYPPGIPLDHPEPWPAALRMYHLAVRAEAYAAIGWPDGAADELVQILAGWQETDGRFVNRESALMKEDDPLLCTALAMIALSHLP